jgi:hypothetical protein
LAVPEVLEHVHVDEDIDILLKPTALQPGATAIQNQPF